MAEPSDFEGALALAPGASRTLPEVAFTATSGDLTFASGLSIYFITGNLVGIAQYALLGKVNWHALLPGQKPVTNALARKK